VHRNYRRGRPDAFFDCDRTVFIPLLLYFSLSPSFSVIVWPSTERVRDFIFYIYINILYTIRTNIYIYIYYCIKGPIVRVFRFFLSPSNAQTHTRTYSPHLLPLLYFFFSTADSVLLQIKGRMIIFDPWLH